MLRGYCHPLAYHPLPNVLYRNTGKGTFVDISAQGRHRRLSRKRPRRRRHRCQRRRLARCVRGQRRHAELSLSEQRKRVFEEVGLLAGVSLAADAKPRAGMGTAFGDYDGDGRLDLVVTNHEFEMHSLFRSLGGGVFTDVTLESGIGPVTLPYVDSASRSSTTTTTADATSRSSTATSWTTSPSSGKARSMRSRACCSATWRSISKCGGQAGPAFAAETVSRALAKGDIDNDGDLDLLITSNGGPCSCC